MKILITGYKGFVGKYFIDKYKNHDIAKIDIADGNDARDFFKTNTEKFDLVIHLAAIVGGRVTIESSPLLVATDLSIDAEMAQWAIRTEPERLVYFSSSAAYPVKYQFANSGIRLSEDLIDLNNISTPDMTYGWSKLSGEYLCSFIPSTKTKKFIFRPFSGYGSDQPLDYPFPSFIARAKSKVDKFEVWGNGEQVRDWIHILDIVDAVDKALTLDIPGTYNLGNGVPTSFNSLAKLVIDISATNSQIIHKLGAPRGVMYRVSDPNKMLSFYSPKISIEDGIRMALDGQ